MRSRGEAWDSALGTPDVGCCVGRFQLSVFVVGGTLLASKADWSHFHTKAFQLVHGFAALLLASLMQLGSFLRIQVWKFGKNEPSARALPILKKGFGDQALSVVA